MSRGPLPFPISAAVGPDDLSRLAEAAAGRGPLLLPCAPGEEATLPGEQDVLDRTVLPDGGGIAIGTSGSTGAAKRAVLPASALAASADATHARLGGGGQWLLALPPHHIAGLQVLLRSLRAGQEPVLVGDSTSFTPGAFTAAVGRLSGTPRYTSLVPTQLRRIMADPAAVRAAASLDAVLVGGSRIGEELLTRARDAGIPVVVTYGMSETAGGCVYDGRPLDGVHLYLDRDRIHLGGAVVACGYLTPRPRQESPFVHHGGLRWFRTDDAGHLHADGRLVVDGRLDDVIVSGGLKVWPSEVERALMARLHDGCDLAVVGVPDPEWGHRVAVVVECSHDVRPVDLLTELFDHARAALPAHARPRLGRVVRRLPRIGPGKPDRAGLASLLMEPGWDDVSPTVLEEG